MDAGTRKLATILFGCMLCVLQWSLLMELAAVQGRRMRHVAGEGKLHGWYCNLTPAQQEIADSSLEIQCVAADGAAFRGTGTYLQPGVILTAAHVLDHPERSDIFARVAFRPLTGGEWRRMEGEAGQLAYDTDCDLAVFSLRRPQDGLRAGTVTSVVPRNGSELVLMGASGAREAPPLRGRVLALLRDGAHIATSLQAAPGDSGAGAWTADGNGWHVAGVVIATASHAEAGALARRRSRQELAAGTGTPAEPGQGCYALCAQVTAEILRRFSDDPLAVASSASASFAPSRACLRFNIRAVEASSTTPTAVCATNLPYSRGLARSAAVRGSVCGHRNAGLSHVRCPRRARSGGLERPAPPSRVARCSLSRRAPQRPGARVWAVLCRDDPLHAAATSKALSRDWALFPVLRAMEGGTAHLSVLSRDANAEFDEAASELIFHEP